MCPSPDSLEMRRISASGRPRRTAARPGVTYFGIWLSMICALSRRECGGHGILFHGHDHGLVDIDVPPLANAHAQGFAAIFQELATKRNPNVAQRDLQDYRLPNPCRERDVQGPSVAAVHPDAGRI